MDVRVIVALIGAIATIIAAIIMASFLGGDGGSGGITPPDDGGGGITPPDDGGGGITPPDDGGGGITLPDDGGGGITPPDDGGGGITLPDDGSDEITPPDDGSDEITPPDDGSDEITPPDGGEISVMVNTYPRTILAGSSTEISVLALSNNVPVASANVKISAGGGVFEDTGNVVVTGITDANGVFKTIWRTYERSAYTGDMSYGFGVEVSKSGYISGNGRGQVFITI